MGERIPIVDCDRGFGGTKGFIEAVVEPIMRNARTGRAMFLTAWVPMSSKPKSILPSTWSWALPEIQMPPGSARLSSRAATLTPFLPAR
ncbi:MAG: hypothetical protein QF926_13570 [Alphaproteobacteria bacterium]|jgi:hypothetical protein|nr:hypothetical protein [Alphaproteobacteria bacterium]